MNKYEEEYIEWAKEAGFTEEQARFLFVEQYEAFIFKDSEGIEYIGV